MHRSDYILIAEALNKAQSVHVSDDFQRGKKHGALVAAEFIADALAVNPKFMRGHFLQVVRGEKPLKSRPGRRTSRKTQIDHSTCPECHECMCLHKTFNGHPPANWRETMPYKVQRGHRGTRRHV